MSEAKKLDVAAEWTDAKDSRTRGRIRIAIAAAAVLLLVLAGLGWHFAGRESTDDAQVDGHVVPISPRVGGTVTSVEVKDNQMVEAGAVLVRLDTRDYEVAVARAKADLAEAEAKAQGARTAVPVESTNSASAVATAQSDVAGAQARLLSVKARQREAEVASATANRDVERYRPLVAKEEISRQDFDLANARAESAAAAVESAKAAVVEAERAVEASNARLAQARTAPEKVAMSEAHATSESALVDQKRAALQQAELNLSYAVIKAPVAGMVSRKQAEPGQTVQPGQPLLAVVPLDDVWVTANFKENQLKKMRPGQAVEVHVDAYGRTYHGKVDSIAPATGARFSLLPPENASGNFVKVVQRVPVKIVLDKGQDSEHLLRPGMSVVPTVMTR